MFSHLYIHIPFCLRKCGYCAFASLETDGGDLGWYAELLISELQLRSRSVSVSEPLESVYFGGGTPSLLAPVHVARIIAEAGRLFGLAADCEITLEANPGTVDLERLAAYRAGGINRLSLGVQSFDDSLLACLGRIHTAAQAHDAVAAARAAGFRNISIDLMHSLPGQTAAMWQKELATAVSLGCEHLSVYGLTIEDGTPFAQRYDGDDAALPDEDLSAAMFEAADEYLATNGYRHYEIANYCRPGLESRHNSGYWRRHGYLGVGAAAHSLLLAQDGVRFHNPDEPESYRLAMEAGTLCCCDEERLTRADAMAEFMFLGLRMADGVTDAEFERLFGVALDAVYGNQLAEYVGQGLLGYDAGRYRLTRRGMLLSNRVFSGFLQ